jgi:protein-S-isoprenylcysteine O-methyltransferase Ste14
MQEGKGIRPPAAGPWGAAGHRDRLPEVAEPNQDSSGVRVFPPILFVGGLAIGFLVQWLVPLPIVPASTPLLAALVHRLGAALVVLWLALSIYAVATFRRAGTTPNPTRPTTALASGGPYRFTRNPMYLALAFLQAGIALYWNVFWPLAALVPVLYIVRHAVIDREERYLEGKFGDEYRAYQARVRRWL